MYENMKERVYKGNCRGRSFSIKMSTLRTHPILYSYPIDGLRLLRGRVLPMPPIIAFWLSIVGEANGNWFSFVEPFIVCPKQGVLLIELRWLIPQVCGEVTKFAPGSMNESRRDKNRRLSGAYAFLKDYGDSVVALD